MRAPYFKGIFMSKNNENNAKNNENKPNNNENSPKTNKMVKVRFIAGYWGIYGVFQPKQVAEVPETVANRFVKDGIAEIPKDEK